MQIRTNIVRDTEAKYTAKITDHFRFFLCNFYTEALAGMLINLFQNPNKCDRTELFEYFSVILYNSLPAVICSQNTEKSDM